MGAVRDADGCAPFAVLRSTASNAEPRRSVRCGTARRPGHTRGTPREDGVEQRSVGEGSPLAATAADEGDKTTVLHVYNVKNLYAAVVEAYIQ